MSKAVNGREPPPARGWSKAAAVPKPVIQGRGLLPVTTGVTVKVPPITKAPANLLRGATGHPPVPIVQTEATRPAEAAAVAAREATAAEVPHPHQKVTARAIQAVPAVREAPAAGRAPHPEEDGNRKG